MIRYIREAWLRLLRMGARLVGHDICWDFSRSAQLSHLKPTLVLDVGVAHGTDFLEAAFPQAAFYLFEANPAYYQELRAKVARRQGWKLFETALGREPGALPLSCNALASSLAAPTSGQGQIQGQIMVPVARLDDVLAIPASAGDVFLKIDTEGYEMAVLSGAEQTLSKVQAVLVELRLQAGAPYHPQELLDFMRAKGFQLTRILHAAARPKGYSYVDALFERLEKTH